MELHDASFNASDREGRGLGACQPAVRIYLVIEISNVLSPAFTSTVNPLVPRS